MQVVVQTRHVHTRVVLLVGRVHTCVALPKGLVPIDKFIYVEDFCLISIGVEDVS
jgi:hypothetical protein